MLEFIWFLIVVRLAWFIGGILMLAVIVGVCYVLGALYEWLRRKFKI